MPWAMTPACVWSDALANSRRTQKAEPKTEPLVPAQTLENVAACLDLVPLAEALQAKAAADDRQREWLTGAGAAG